MRLRESEELLLPEDNVAGLGTLDDGQGLQVYPGGTQAVAATLEALLHGGVVRLRLGFTKSGGVGKPARQ